MSDDKKNAGSNKRAMRLTQAKLAVTRADREIQTKPGAQATLLIRDMRLAIKDLIYELENHTTPTGKTGAKI